jgi:hypothetical protein
MRSSYQQIGMRQIRYEERTPKSQARMFKIQFLEKRPPPKRKVIRPVRPRPPKLVTPVVALDAEVKDLRLVANEVDDGNQVPTFRQPVFFVESDEDVNIHVTAFAAAVVKRA